MQLIKTPQEMEILWEQLSKKYKILLLEGDLGSWKTTLTKGFVKWLGINTDQVHSPTYTYINIYDDTILHIDMRRIKEYQEIIEKGIIEQIHQFEYIIVERPKFKEKLWLDKITTVTIKKTSPNTREVEVFN